MIRKFSFQCQFCQAVSMVDFDVVCTPCCVLQLKKAAREKKQRIQQVVQQLISLLLE